ncbi:PH domain-containing protein [Hymenobacter sp. ISL-91]|uniref:PH domain-containing protein n=1 Tax=Hymenobacter sp. ISL-91 TaxID=2819151 RepID=UPI001BE52FD6|nr:PH domain-containing protein [Hymenobacter sp. ISL-91]MBT2557700.1 PH domain-containing protein [Hymenobacter sp. ISL-91]
MNQVFHSKVSWWLFGPILALLLGIGLVVTLNGRWISALPLLAPLGLILWLLRRTYYEIQPQSQLLRIVSGPFTWQVPINSISQVEVTKNPIASPALALHRLRLYYGKYDSVLISPADQSGFLTILRHLNPAIRYE